MEFSHTLSLTQSRNLFSLIPLMQKKKNHLVCFFFITEWTYYVNGLRFINALEWNYFYMYQCSRREIVHQQILMHKCLPSYSPWLTLLGDIVYNKLNIYFLVLIFFFVATIH